MRSEVLTGCSLCETYGIYRLIYLFTCLFNTFIRSFILLFIHSRFILLELGLSLPILTALHALPSPLLNRDSRRFQPSTVAFAQSLLPNFSNRTRNHT